MPGMRWAACDVGCPGCAAAEVIVRWQQLVQQAPLLEQCMCTCV